LWLPSFEDLGCPGGLFKAQSTEAHVGKGNLLRQKEKPNEFGPFTVIGSWLKPYRAEGVGKRRGTGALGPPVCVGV